MYAAGFYSHFLLLKNIHKALWCKRVFALHSIFAEKKFKNMKVERLFLNSCRYKCINKKDGIAKKVDSNGTMEGSDDRDRAYKCDSEGIYTLPKGIGNSYKFPKCIPRRK